ncbi:MAG: hypothetical protein WDO14_19100 [Bacteroidota bacterium]
MSFANVFTFIVFVLSLASSAFGQGELPVNMYTGTPIISVGLYALKDHDLSESISLVYDPADLRVGSAHTYGVGWALSSDNQSVSRVVRGLPDDYSDGTRKGWLYNTNYSGITAFAGSSDNSTSTCTDEASDQSFLSSLGYVKDTEPDIFSYSVNGISGRFVFGNDGIISMIPYQDIIIVPIYQTYPTNLTIIGWKITMTNGVKYLLDGVCSITRQLSKSSNDVEGANETQLSLFEREYSYYQTSTTFNSSWMLTSAQSPSGAKLTYTYTTTTTYPNSKRRARIFDATWPTGLGNVATKSDYILMSEAVTETKKRLSGISTSSGLSASIDPIDGIAITDSFHATTPFRKFIFSYTSGFLTTLTETDGSTCNQLPPYRFRYTNQVSYPPVNSPSTDFWGYFNGAANADALENPYASIPTIYVYPTEAAAERYRIHPIPSYSGTYYVLSGESNKLTDPNAVLAGSLARLIYPSGGETDIKFEANTYYDTRAGRDQYGGGLRVNTVTYYDGVNPSANIIKKFTYTDSGHSSGKIFSRPSYAMPVWKYVAPTWGSHSAITKTYDTLSAAKQWKYMTVVTDFDFGDQVTTAGSTIGYTNVKVVRPGSGYGLYTYAAPAAYGDAATGSGATDWKPTVTKFARPATCPGMKIIPAGDVNLPGSIPHTFYDYERGLMLTKSEYNESGTLVRSTSSTYQYIYKSGSAPKNIVGVSYDKLANSDDAIFLFGKYTLLADVSRVLSSEAVTIYDENDASRHMTETTQYTFGSAYHKMLSKISKTLADGTIYGTSMKYVLDFPFTGTPGDSTLYMLKMLKDSSRTAMVIEEVNTIQKPSESEKTLNGSLVKLRRFSGNPQIKYRLVSRPLNPTTAFQAAHVTSNVFVNDTSYQTIEVIHEYAKYSEPISATGSDSVTTAALWGYKQRVPIGSVKFSKISNMAFSDFETTTNAAFTVANGFYGAGRTGKRGVHPFATLSRTIKRLPNTSKYLFTFWLKSTSAVTIRLTFKNGSTEVSHIDYSCTPSGTPYQYFSKLVDLSSMPTLASTFNIEVSGPGLSSPGSSSPSLLPLLDDVSFYPSQALVSTSAYDVAYGPTASTSSSGMTAFTTYDSLGRTRWILDQDGNIRRQYTYEMTGDTRASLLAAVSSSELTNRYVQQNFQLAATISSCVSGSLYSWSFDGGSFSTAGASNLSPVMNYPVSSAGSHSFTLRVTNPNYSAPVDLVSSVNVGYAPLEISICAAGTRVFSGGHTTQSYACFTDPGGDRVSFKAAEIDYDYGHTIAYQWKQRNVGSSTWTNIGGSIDTYVHGPVTSSTTSFEVMCTITVDTRTADSQIMTVTVN